MIDFHHIRNRPVRLEFLLLGGVIAGVLLFRGLHFAGVLFALPLFALWKPRTATAAALALALGVAAGWFGGYRLPGHYARLLDGRERGGEIEVRVTDSGLTSLAEMPGKGLIAAEVTAVRLAGEPEMRPAHGKIFFQEPRSGVIHWHYGDRARLSGRFTLPENRTVHIAPDGTLLGAGDAGYFGNYLAARGVDAVFRYRTAEKTGREPGVLGHILTVRDFLLRRAIGHVEPERFRQEIAGLFFGCKGGLDPATRRDLIRSGTIHVFAVSGLHVGVLAGVMLWLLRPLPFRARYWLLALLTGIYAVTTGANVPAMRAFGMIAAWCLLRTCLFRVPSVNVMCVLAAAFIAVNPGNLNDLGFWYSFLITGILVLFSRSWRDGGELFGYPAPLMAYSRRRMLAGWSGNVRRKVLLALLGCMAAFLGGAGISLYCQGLFLPGSILANIVVLPLVGVLFLVMAGKLLLGWIPLADRLGAWIVETLFQLFDLVTGSAAALFDSSTGRVPLLWELLIFYAGLLLVLWPGKNMRRRVAGAAVMCGVVLCWHGPAVGAPPSLLVCRGGAARVPALAFADTAAGIGVVVNAPDGDAAAAMARHLKSAGIGRIDRVIFSESRSASAAGLTALLREMPVNVVVLPEASRGDFAFQNQLKRMLESFPNQPFTVGGGNFTEIIRENDTLKVEYYNHGSNFKCSVFFGDTLKVESGGNSFERPLQQSSAMEITRYEFR